MLGISDSTSIKVIEFKILKAVLPRSQQNLFTTEHRHSEFQVAIARMIAGWSTLMVSGHLVTQMWLFSFCRMRQIDRWNVLTRVFR